MTEIRRAFKEFLIWYCARKVSIGQICEMTELVNQFFTERAIK